MAFTAATAITLWQKNLDEQVVLGSVTNNLEANSAMVQYNGGKVIKIGKLETSGMTDYSRTAGFTAGSAALTWEEYTMTMDRSQEFSIDSLDVDENAFIPTATALMSNFQSNFVIPEIDAYRLSTLSALAHENGHFEESYVPAKATILADLKKAIRAVTKVGCPTPVAYVSYDVLEALENCDGVTRTISGDKEGAINTKVLSIDGVQLIPVTDNRFYSAYTYATGFAKTATAVNLNFLIVVPSYVTAINKLEKIRLFQPDVNQSMDAYKIQYRRFHDIFVPDNKTVGLYASYKAPYAV